MFANHPLVWSSLVSIFTLGTASTIYGANFESNVGLSGLSSEDTASYRQAHSNVIARNIPNTDARTGGGGK